MYIYIYINYRKFYSSWLHTSPATPPTANSNPKLLFRNHNPAQICSSWVSGCKCCIWRPCNNVMALFHRAVLAALAIARFHRSTWRLISRKKASVTRWVALLINSNRTRSIHWGYYGVFVLCCICSNSIHQPWKSKTKQRMVFRMIHIQDFPTTNGQSLVGLDSLS